jgi:molybdopterin biosynthesis enzyme
MVEHTSLSGRTVEVRRGVSSGENFVPRGAEAGAGQLLLDKGRRLDHAGIAIAASVGKSRLQVFRKPRVAVLSTGDELVEIDALPGPGADSEFEFVFSRGAGSECGRRSGAAADQLPMNRSGCGL